MVAADRHRVFALAFYAAFNGALMLFAGISVQSIVQMASSIRPQSTEIAEAPPSRVDKFKIAEAAAALAPQVPVPRTIVAFSVPDMPVQVLAARIDRAENVKVKPVKLKRRTLARIAKANDRRRKAAPSTEVAGKIPAVVALFASADAGNAPQKRTKKQAVVAESSRDITNRSLGVLVAMKY
jgi:hypothetical protein